jgi:hypothetical protein
MRLLENLIPGEQKQPTTRYWRNIKFKQTGNTELVKKIEREVTSLSFVIGSLIALAFRIDLFKMIPTVDPRLVLFWNGIEKGLFFLSIPLTVFFILWLLNFFMT